MADFDSHITRQTQARGIAELDVALEWLTGFLTTPLKGRFREYRQILTKVLRRVLENKIELLALELPQTDYLNAFYEAETLIQIWKCFKSRPSVGLTEKLKIAITGVTSALDGEKYTQGRDAIFELQLAAILMEGGIDIRLGDPTDLIANFRGTRLLIECKRLQTANSIAGNLEKAERQLSKGLSRISTVPARGIIALDASKIYHLSYRGVPFYLKSRVGIGLLPSSVLVAESDNALLHLMRFRFLRFALSHRVFWTRNFEKDLIGIIIFFAASSVSRQRYGLFHCRYPHFEPFQNIPREDNALLNSFVESLRRDASLNATAFVS